MSWNCFSALSFTITIAVIILYLLRQSNQSVISYRSFFLAIISPFSRSDWRHKLCRDFVVLAVPMTLAEFPPYAKGTLSIESQCIFLKSYPKLSNLHKITFYNAHMFALLISKVTRKMMLYLKWKSSLYKSNGNSRVRAVPFYSTNGWGSAVTE